MTVTGVLFDDLTVTLDPASLRYGGSWYADGHAPESALLRTFYRWCRGRGDTLLLDIGASTGAFALLAAHLPNLRVVAFEPVQAVADTLTRNVQMNGLGDRVLVLQVAVGATDGHDTFYEVMPDASIALSMLGGIPSSHKSVKAQTVPVLTIDSLSQTFPDINAIKVDVEGGELAVLRGGTETLTCRKPALIVECCYENTAQYKLMPHDTVTFLTGLGYRCRLNDIDLLTEDFDGLT